MDPYEKIRKMGKIQEELKKHGLADNSEEALNQAEKIMDSKNHDFYVSKDQLKNMEKPKEKPEESNKNNDAATKIVSQLSDRLSTTESDIQLIRDKMNEIIVKINDIESKVNSQSKQEVQATLNTDNQVKEEKPKEKQDIKSETKKEFTSDDVSVDKIFYVGQK